MGVIKLVAMYALGNPSTAALEDGMIETQTVRLHLP